jgi:hypothetical protein
MKRALLVLGVVLWALPSFAAIQYDYTQKSVTEDAVVPTTDLAARALVDGTRTRVEFLSGNLYPPGTYVVSSDGARLFFVDPTKKWYTEFNAAGAVSAIGASNIKIENFRSDFKNLNDTPLIAGVPTQHSQLVLDYDITLTLRQMPLKQSVHTVIDSWTTSKFGGVGSNLFATDVRTGNADIDHMLDLETMKITGFPLKQSVSIRTTLLNRPVESKLKINPTRTILREMQVSAIKETQPKAGDFAVPAGYTRADTAERPRTATQVLTFEPQGK